MRCLSTGEVVENEEIVLQFPEGTYKTISVNAGPVIDETGRMIAAVCAFDDVTEARRSELALIESENRFRRLAGTIPHIVWVYNIDGSLEFFNDGWFEYTGMSEAQSRAGYELLVKRKNPQATWVKMARQDLATAYRALGRPADADRFQAELAAASSLSTK